jgi:hypothetical protein
MLLDVLGNLLQIPFVIAIVVPVLGDDGDSEAAVGDRKSICIRLFTIDTYEDIVPLIFGEMLKYFGMY